MMSPRRLALALRSWTSLCGVRIASMLVAGMSPAAAQVGHWVGDWRQVESSAGQCPSCRITISGMGRVLTVTASNGWTAQVMADVENGLAAAHGEGHLTERGNLLHMTMQIMRAGRSWTVRAAFGRR